MTKPLKVHYSYVGETSLKIPEKNIVGNLNIRGSVSDTTFNVEKDLQICDSTFGGKVEIRVNGCVMLNNVVSVAEMKIEETGKNEIERLNKAIKRLRAKIKKSKNTKSKYEKTTLTKKKR